MESNYSNRDFEQHIKENADQYRMFPSDKVWKGVHSALHTRRKWYGFGLAFLLLVTGGAVTWVMTVYPVSKKQNETSLEAGQAEKALAEQHSSSSLSSTQAIKDLLPFTGEPTQSPDRAERVLAETAIPMPPADLLVDLTGLTEEDIAIKQHPFQRLEREPAANNFNTILITNIDLPQALTGEPAASPLSVASLPPIAGKKGTPLADANLLTIESVTNSYKHPSISRRISWQVFVTPTVSYRKLSVNKSYDNLTASNSPAPAANYPFASITNVNNAVTHKPDLGFQLGVAARYPLTRNLRLRGGLQFNVNRYDIKALAYNGGIATINLNSGTGENNSVSTWTRYRNYSGYRSDWLKNFYFSVSAPIGAELTLFGNSKTSMGVAGTVQPTYIISDRAFLISTDFKNYAKIPWLIRKVNVSSSFEAFVNYTRGKTKWQIGPQVRYQMLSSFKNKYPVKENLFDFGMKLGLTLNE